MPDDQQLYMDISHHPLADATIKDIERLSLSRGNDPARFDGLRERAMMLRKDTPLCSSQRHIRSCI